MPAFVDQLYRSIPFRSFAIDTIVSAVVVSPDRFLLECWRIRSALTEIFIPQYDPLKISSRVETPINETLGWIINDVRPRCSQQILFRPGSHRNRTLRKIDECI